MNYKISKFETNLLSTIITNSRRLEAMGVNHVLSRKASNGRHNEENKDGLPVDMLMIEVRA